jgi:ubiquinone/menaquinone biosynthesis C-methylase UbiE
VKVTTVDFDARLEPDIVADVRHVPVPDKSYDVVMACQVLEHIPFDDFSHALVELKRISRNNVVISLPRRTSYFELVIRFPFIRTLMNRSFLDLSFQKYLKFGGFGKASNEHYFEIDNDEYRLSKVRGKILEHFDILDEFSPVLHKYHYFFILKPRT